jgi:uncharacterized membrane protein YfcA
MGIGMIIMLPIGIFLLGQMESTTYRYFVSIATLACVVLLVSGVRYTRPLTPKVIIGTGGIGGFLGGVAGVPGPPVMVLYMASRLPAETVRANLILFLLMADLLIFPIMALQGMLSWQAIIVGGIILLPYMAGSAVGAALFDPSKERVYRVVAYFVIAGSAIVGLPLWMS